jgi:hypothetical protein
MEKTPGVIIPSAGLYHPGVELFSKSLAGWEKMSGTVAQFVTAPNTVDDIVAQRKAQGLE